MAKRQSTRQAARRRSAAARHPRAAKPLGRSLYYRTLRCEPLEDRRLLAVVTVDTLDDSVDLGDGLVSLREAIFATNTVPGPDTIRFDPALTAGGPATILLEHGELLITDDLSIEGPGAELLTIDASGNDDTPDVLDGMGSRIFNVDDGNAAAMISVDLHGLTLTGGDSNDSGGAVFSREQLWITDSTIVGNHVQVLELTIPFRGGAGIYSTGSLRLTNSEVSDNRLSLSNPGMLGAGVHSRGAELIVEGCLIAGNVGSSNTRGGGIYSNALVTRITDSTISDNQATSGAGILCQSEVFEVIDSLILNNGFPLSILTRGIGGGVTSDADSTLISNSTIAGNRAGDGGGIYTSTSVTIVDSTIADNVAKNGGGMLGGSFAEYVIIRSTIRGNRVEYGGDGGGVFIFSISESALTMVDSSVIDNSAEDQGGGLFISGGANITGSTVSGNRSGRDGGGAFVLGGEMKEISIAHSTIANNVAGERPCSVGTGGGIYRQSGLLSLIHTIVVDNHDDGIAPDVAGVFSSNYSLIGIGAEFLGPLSDNGGPTPTHALLPGSPAINAGDPDLQLGNQDVPLNDQRGVPHARVYGGRIDIGAIESQPTGILLGDYNQNGTVDSADYTVWRDEMTAGGSILFNADGNGDGTVDNADFQVWRSNFGATLYDLPAWNVAATFASASAPTESEEASEPDTSPQFDPPTSTAIAAELTSGRPIARRADRAMAPRADFARTHFDQADFDWAARQDRLLGAWAAATLPRGDSLEMRGESLFDPAGECEAADCPAQSIDVVFTRLGAQHAKALVR